MKSSDILNEKTIRWGYTKALAFLLILGILIPVLFTEIQMGLFSKEPMVEPQTAPAPPGSPVLRIATDYDFCPNSYINQNGELSGLYIEIVTEAANRLGMTPEFEIGEWLACRKMLTEKEVDVLLGLEIFSNMEGTLRTIPICSDELRVYGKEEIDSPAALAGKRVALMARSVIEATYDLQCEYVEYYTNTEILKAVENGDVDYGICHAAVSSKIIKRYDLNLQSGLVIAKSFPALAVDDSRPELKEQLNTVLQEMSVDGTIGRLQQKWITNFTKNESLSYVLDANAPFYISFFFVVVVLFCAFVGFHMLDLRRTQYIHSLLDYQKKLQASNEEAVRANRAKSDFLSHMSHDIRTPMNGIMGMVERIRRSRQDPAVVEDSLNKIDAASGHLLSLLNDVLDMSALEQGSVRLENRPFDLLGELESVRLIVEEQAKAADVHFAVHTDRVLHSHLVGSPLHLRRILLNLISNSLKYNKPNGRVDLSVEESPLEEGKAKFLFCIRDTGIGMSEEFLQKRLYQPFMQENGGARTVYQGTGLGMSIVSELIKTMGGTIEAESKQNVGTTFRITLSFALDGEPQRETSLASGCRDLAGMRVMIVEDNDLNREIARSLLEDEKIEVETAVNGQKAVELFAASSPGTFDAILMDVMMPVMDGLEATRAIRALPRADAAQIPIIAMTANAFDEDKKKVFDAGMNAHLAKPVDSRQLYEILAKYRKKC